TSSSDLEDPMGLSASLRLEGGHIKGSILNRTGRAIHQLQLVNGVGSVGRLADNLAAGATAQVDTQLNQGGAISSLAGPADTTREGERDAVLRLAASQVLAGRSGADDLALVGLTSPTRSLTVDDQKPPGPPWLQWWSRSTCSPPIRWDR